MADFAKYLGIIGMLIFVYLVVQGGQKSTDVINALGNVNTGAIKALQGR